MAKPKQKYIKAEFPFRITPNKPINNYHLFWTGTLAVAANYGYALGLADGVAANGTEIISLQGCGAEAMTLQINRLKSKELKTPFDLIIEPDGDGFIAKTPDLPLFGYGDDRDEAIDNLKAEIESLYEDLLADDDFSEEWLRIKAFLKERVIN